MSNFAFLAAEFPAVHEAAVEAERQAGVSPTAAAFFAGKTVEVAVKWAFRSDPNLRLPYQDNISALLHEPSFKRAAGDAVFTKAKYINSLRNRAVHEERNIRPGDAAGAVKELFHVCYWFARTYGRKSKPAPGLAFDASLLSRRDEVLKKALDHLKQQQVALDAKNGELTKLLADKQNLDDELKRLRAEVSAARKTAEATPDQHDYNEAETRDRYIDLLLREAGWALDKPEDVEFPVEGMSNNEGKGFVDYVLWGADGKPVGIVEAKRTRKDARQGQQQAKLYADCLERKYGQRPVIFYSNGYEHWIWDDTRYPPRQIGGFYKRDELELLIQRRTSRKKLSDVAINTAIAGHKRPYQQRAIRAIAKHFEEDGERKGLLVMATGSGKTRTVIALVDLLMRAGWVKRVLFLADRIALVNQAVGAFKTHLPDSAPVNLVTERTSGGRVFLSTYPTMMNLIDGKQDGKVKFGPGHFDLVIIDEAHRSVYQRFRSIFEYFDSFLVGLTATPKDEVDKNTYSLFDLEDGVPTDAYSLDEAIAEGVLVPPKAISVPLKIVRSGLRYDDLTDEEKDQWDSLEWGEDEIPDTVDAAEVNQRLFNQDTVDLVIADVMKNGVKVEGGDRLGKTIIFAKNQQHAQFIEARFNAAYPHLAGHFARVITYETGAYAQTLIDDFSKKSRPPHIAISVDMLDTGIDVPEVVNLVFFKQVRSKTKFWQMMGRGTRLCADLFGPGQDKEFFRVFDYCQNLEFFGANPELKDASSSKSLSERLFAARLDLVRALDKKPDGMSEGAQEEYDAKGCEGVPTEAEVRADALKVLQETVSGVNADSFIVRQHRRAVEKYRDPAAWQTIDEQERKELIDEIAPLPTALDLGGEEAKRFDLLMFSLELAHLKGSKRFAALKKQLLEIAAALELQMAIPIVAQRAALIEEIQTETWWEGITVPLLEFVRLRLRDLVQHIDKSKKSIVYSNFADEIGEGVEHELPQVGEADFARFKLKARQFLKAHEDHIALYKLRHCKPLTPTDLAELEKMLLDAGVGDADDIERAKQTSNGFGRFVRSLVGLDRKAVTDAFGDFVSNGNASAAQLEFVKMVIEHLTDQGAMDPGLLYEPPFIDVAPTGPEQVFDDASVARLVSVIRQLNDSAAA